MALKILTANASNTEQESKILETLTRSDAHHPGKKHVMTLRDHFLHEGPNGTHRCLVFDVMGPSAASMVESFPIESAPFQLRERYPFWMAKSILWQTLLGLDFLHSNGIAHGDVQPGNLLFPLKDLNEVEESQLSQQSMDPITPEEEAKAEREETLPRERGISDPVRRLDGKVDHWAPHYLAHNQPLDRFANVSSKFEVKISDLGAAFFFGSPPEKPITPIGLRSPELVVGHKVDKDQDVWSFGCIIFEFICGRKLFCLTPSFGDAGEDLPGIEYEDAEDDPDLNKDDNSTNDEHFLAFHDILGPLPHNLRSQWPRSKIYFNDEGQKTRKYIGKLPKGFDPATIPDLGTLEQLFDDGRPSEIDKREVDMVKDLLRWILQYNPAKRPSTAQLLQHPWVQGTASNGK